MLPPATASLQPVARDECDADLAERSDRRTLRESAEHLPEGIAERAMHVHKLFTMLEVPEHREGAPLAWLTHDASLCAGDATT